MPSLANPSAPGLSRPDMHLQSGASGHTERLSYIPSADDVTDERSATPKTVVIVLVVLAAAVAVALATVFT